jgi:hypothetical protein
MAELNITHNWLLPSIARRATAGVSHPTSTSSASWALSCLPAVGGSNTHRRDGATVFAHACRLGAEGIVSKKVNGTYRSGPSRVWIKVRNPASIAVQRERSEKWNR